jgi:hypothetical protein
MNGVGKDLQRHSPERSPHSIADDAHVRLDPAVGVERAVGAAFGADGHRDRPLDRFDDIGEADVTGSFRKRETARRAAHAPEQPASGELAHQFLSGRERDPGILRKLGCAETRTRGTAGGGGHQHDRIIGEVREAHV